MSLPINKEASETQTARAFRKRMLRQTFAIALGLGISTAALSATAIAQYPSGDVPASPWSKRTESSRRTETIEVNNQEESSRSPSKRLRQPMTTTPVSINVPASSSKGRIAEPQSNKNNRPAPVTLLGPVSPSAEPHANRPTLHEYASSPKPSPATFGSLRDFQQESFVLDVPAGPASQSNIPSASPSEFDSSRQRVSSTVVGNGRISVGLPDRVDERANRFLPSQTASTKSTAGREQPIQLRSTPRSFPAESSDAESGPLNGDRSTRSQPTSKPNPPSRVPLSMGQPRFEEQPTEGETGLEDRDKSPVERRVSEAQMRRIALAERVSSELLSSSPSDFAGPPQALESLPGWQAIEQELRERLDRCDVLLKRGAVLSARQEASEGLLRLYRTMDLHRGQIFSESAFEKAVTALHEELDFHKSIGGRHNAAIQAVVNTHRTEALKNRPLDSTSTEMAAMHYRLYARYQLIAASDGHPWAADLLYAYGKTIEKEAELNPSKASQFRSQSVVFYQAALKAKPSHSEASSQLGYTLIHLDRIDDAYAALSDSIKQKPSANAWNNLAEVFRRRGAPSEAAYAVQQATALSQSTPQFSSENPEIVAVDAATFAKYSPVPTMATPPQNSPLGNQSTSRGANDLSVRSAKSGNSLLSKILR